MSALTPLRSAFRPRASTSRLGLPSQTNNSSRRFSLWPSSQTPTTSTPLPSNPPPPLLLHSPPPAFLDPTFFEPASNLLLAVPAGLGLSYAAFIPLATILLRLSTTLPVTLWQRQRTRRLVDVVMPLVREGQRKLSFECRDECRRKGLSFEEYQKVFKKRAKSLASSLAWKHSATPLLTLAIPPMIHLPIFITTSLVLRDACSRSLAFLSSTLPAPTPALQHLLDLGATPLWWCDSLILPDPTMGLPLLVGLAAMLNVEVSARNRKVNATGVEEGPPKDPRLAGDGKGVGMTAADRRRVETVKARRRAFSTSSSPLAASPSAAPSADPTKPKVLNIHLSHSQAQKLAQAGKLTPAPPPPPPPPEIETSPEEPRTARIVTNVLRVSAVMFIPIAAMAPSAVCAYWLTSNLFTLTQNLVFAWADRRRLRARRIAEVIARS